MMRIKPKLVVNVAVLTLVPVLMDARVVVQSNRAVGAQLVDLTRTRRSGEDMLSDREAIERHDVRLPLDLHALVASLDHVLDGADAEPTRRLGAGLTDEVEKGSQFLRTKKEFARASLAPDPFLSPAGTRPPTGVDAPPSEEGSIWPLDGDVTSGFGPRDGGQHTGLDIDGDTGDPVTASAPGRIVHTDEYFGYGSTVIIDHGSVFSSLYGHLSAIDVKLGREVAQGEVIGLVGCTGECTGDHLHFEIRIDGEPVDPLPYLPGGRWAGLPIPAPKPPAAAFGPVP
jgi:murein DD-endopeptidase MepM/ murein hydrolase activator NlpD